MIAVFVARGNDRAKVLAGFVDLPPHFVVLGPDLHGALVLMPAADLPDVFVGCQLVPDIRGVDGVAGACSSLADEDQLQLSVCEGVHLIVEVRVVRRYADTRQAIF